MQSAVRAMADKGVEIAFLLGEPEYYRRFGFDPRVAAPFSSPYAGPYFMALALCDGFKLPERGRAEYAEAFARLARERKSVGAGRRVGGRVELGGRGHIKEKTIKRQ